MGDLFALRCIHYHIISSAVPGPPLRLLWFLWHPLKQPNICRTQIGEPYLPKLMFAVDSKRDEDEDENEEDVQELKQKEERDV